LLRKLMTLSGIVFVIAATNTAQAFPAKHNNIAKLRVSVNWHRQQTWNWESIALVKPAKTTYSEKASHSESYLRWLSHKWSLRRIAAKRYASTPPHYDDWLCIHRGEGSWNDPNAPYYGGLQMDLSFQRAYGWDALKKWGTADHWNPLTQMWVAERAFSAGRGFYPWPNTARWCGLI